MMLAFLGACFGDSTGRLHVGVGSGPHLADNGNPPTKHSADTISPGQMKRGWRREKSSEPATKAMFRVPLLMWADKRTPAAAVALRLVHTDIDHGQLDPKKVQQLPGAFAVSSGTPGNGHVYVPLAAALTAPQHRTLCKALGLASAARRRSPRTIFRARLAPSITSPRPPAACRQWSLAGTSSGVLADPAPWQRCWVLTWPTPRPPQRTRVSHRWISRHPRVRDALQKDTGDHRYHAGGRACLNDGLTEANAFGDEHPRRLGCSA